VRIYVFVEICI